MIQGANNGLFSVTVRQPTGKMNQPVSNLVYYRIRAFEAYPELAHAIFTRQGGMSRTPFATLNLGPSVGDDPAAVAHNLQRACRILDTTPGPDRFLSPDSQRRRFNR